MWWHGSYSSIWDIRGATPKTETKHHFGKPSRMSSVLTCSTVLLLCIVSSRTDLTPGFWRTPWSFTLATGQHGWSKYKNTWTITASGPDVRHSLSDCHKWFLIRPIYCKGHSHGNPYLNPFCYCVVPTQTKIGNLWISSLSSCLRGTLTSLFSLSFLESCLHPFSLVCLAGAD